MQDTTQSPAIPESTGYVRLRRASPAFLLICSLALIALQGCVNLSSRNSPPLGYAAIVGDSPMSIRTLGADRRYSQQSSGDIARQIQARNPGEPINILALSGGGAGGAFGAGAIVGLSRSGQRPEFAVVTGVSAGALIAPYAFLGPAWDHQLMEIYTSGSGEHVLQSRGLGAVFGSSMYRGTPLKELVDRYATDALIESIAFEASKGRLLLVATTDVNTGEPVVWDLGAIAMHGGSEARALFRDVLVASASVPGLFPPIIIRVPDDGGQRNETHVDGGVTLPFFVVPSPADMPGDSIDQTADQAQARSARLYVLIDGQLGEQPRATRLRTSTIMSRSVSASLNRMMRTTLELTAAAAERRGIALDYSAIPVSYPYHGALDFSAGTVRPLFQYAYECARTGRLWTAFRPAAGPMAGTQVGLDGPTAPCPADDAFIARFAARQR
jgi:predicted acylesterase/phospholipase RssA